MALAVFASEVFERRMAHLLHTRHGQEASDARVDGVPPSPSPPPAVAADAARAPSVGELRERSFRAVVAAIVDALRRAPTHDVYRTSLDIAAPVEVVCDAVRAANLDAEIVVSYELVSPKNAESVEWKRVRVWFDWTPKIISC
jgi:hypothetical protein